MTRPLTLAQMLGNLEARIAFHRERKEFHAAQEVHHREQLAHHDAELSQILERYEALKTAAEAAEAYAAPPPPPEPETDARALKRYGSRPMVSRLIANVVASQPPGEEFGARAIAAEVNRRYGKVLGSPTSSAAVSVVLRRLREARKIRQVRPGKASAEALYVVG